MRRILRIYRIKPLSGKNPVILFSIL